MSEKQSSATVNGVQVTVNSALDALANDAAERTYYSALVLCDVPAHLHEGFVMYLVHHVNPGSFLRAVLENKLRDSLWRADATSARMMPEIVRFLYEFAPCGAWGSEELVAEYLKGGRR
jgi:hypothetical protein